MLENFLDNFYRSTSSTLLTFNLASALSQTYMLTKDYRIDDDSFVFIQLLIAYRLRKSNNPLVAVFCIIALYHYYARGEPMKEFI